MGRSTPPTVLENSDWCQATTKQLYKLIWLGAELGPWGSQRAWGRVWLRGLSMAASDVNYLLLNNKVQTRERQYRLGKVEDPYCPLEVTLKLEREGPATEAGDGPGTLAVAGPVEDWRHKLTTCVKVQEVWGHLRGLVERFLGRQVETEALITRTFRPGPGSITVAWLVATYCQFILVEARRGTRICVRNLTSFLSSAMDQLQRRGGISPTILL